MPSGEGGCPGSCCWPTGGEIDILEAVGTYRHNCVFGTYHWAVACGKDEWTQHEINGNFPLNWNATQSNFSMGFSEFAVEWNETAITWSVDNTTYITRTAHEAADPTLFIPQW